MPRSLEDLAALRFVLPVNFQLRNLGRRMSCLKENVHVRVFVTLVEEMEEAEEALQTINEYLNSEVIANKS